MTTLTTMRAALDALERVSLVDDILSPSLCGAVNNSAADLRTLIAAMEKSEPFAWAIHYKDSAESHGVVLDTDRELAISRCEDCMGNGVESYSLPVPLYTHAQPVEQPLLTEQELMKCIAKAGCFGAVKMTYESGPYDIDVLSAKATYLCRAIEQAIRSKQA